MMARCDGFNLLLTSLTSSTAPMENRSSSTGWWKVILGGGRNSSSDTLYFTAGPNDETNGLFGTITPASKQ